VKVDLNSTPCRNIKARSICHSAGPEVLEYEQSARQQIGWGAEPLPPLSNTVKER
jgi:hypothetical protein